MPRPPGFRTSALGELFRQLRYAPRETLSRQMDAAERLIGDIDPDGTYPADFIVFRITGYRPDRVESAPAAFPGEAVLGDLVSFVQRLSGRLDLRPDDLGREALSLDALAARLRVTPRSIRRYRRRGLVCHYVVDADGDKRLACFEDAAQRFTERHRRALDRAARFTRVGDDAERLIIEEARRLGAEEGLTLNRAARRLARMHGRADETIRGILRRHDRRGATPIFDEHGPLTERDGRLVRRALRRGISASALAERFGKTATSIRRADHEHRWSLLASLVLEWTPLATFDLDDAEAVILSAPAVTENLDRLPPDDDALALVAEALPSPPPDEWIEHALVAGYNLLKRRVHTRLGSRPGDAPRGAAALDRIETDLRWATRLKRRLVSLALPAALTSVEQNLHHALSAQGGDDIVVLVRLSIDVSSRVVEGLDPGRGQRLARLAAQATDRALAAPGPGREIVRRAGRPGRAVARHDRGGVPARGLLAGLTPWEEVLDLSRGRRQRVARLPDAQRDLVVLRYGLGPLPPLTRSQIAARIGRSPVAVARSLSRVEAQLARRAASDVLDSEG